MLDQVEIVRLCEYVKAPLCAFVEDPDKSTLRLLFVMTEERAGEVMPRILAAREMLDRERPAGVQIKFVYRFATMDQIEACSALNRLAGHEEALLQVFGLKAEEDWQ